MHMSVFWEGEYSETEENTDDDDDDSQMMKVHQKIYSALIYSGSFTH